MKNNILGEKMAKTRKKGTSLLRIIKNFDKITEITLSNHAKILKLYDKKFGKLLAIIPISQDKRHKILWLCKCDCGNYVAVCASNLNNGHTKSCGCLQREIASNLKLQRTHGLSSTLLFKVWCGIKRRCYNIHEFSYKYYGGRGIKMCDEWLDNFKVFYDWAIGSGYREEKINDRANNITIERIDVNGNYEPNNCCWVTMSEQANNKRNAVKLKINEKEYSIAQISKALGIKDKVLYHQAYKYGKEKATSFLLNYCCSQNIDIEKIMEIKCNYNKTRSYKHGNKKIQKEKIYG